MKKVIIIGGCAFVIALIAGTVARVAVAPPPAEAPAVLEAGAAGETHGKGEGAKASSPEEPHPKPSTHPTPAAEPKATDAIPSPADTEPVAEHGTTPKSHDAKEETPAVRTTPGTSSPSMTTDPKELKLLARILTNMKPAEAAKVVRDLPDEQLEQLIVAMGPRQAASLLAQLPAERAANLSKLLLEPAKEEHP